MTATTIKLAEIAHARSGDKGNHANIAIIAYTPAGFAWLREQLTTEVVASFLLPKGPNPPRVERYEAPNVRAFNFVLYDVLDGGASQSLRIDTQGKTLGLALLQMDLPRPPNVQDMFRKQRAPLGREVGQ